MVQKGTENATAIVIRFIFASIVSCLINARALAENTNMAEVVELQKRVKELEKENARLKQELSVQMDKYGLYWLDCPEAFDADSENKIPVLEEVEGNGIKHDDGKPTHVLIEGDNYHALTCLNFTHRGKIDVIYIDPPYNTGNDDFIYKDKRFLVEFPDGQTIGKDHPLRHSSWLSFMWRRLNLAQSLLADRGVIFISIDDNEQANLKLLCDKVFDEKNFVADLVWKSKSGGANDAAGFAVDTEHILVYAQNVERMKIGLDDEATVTTSYNREDEFGKYALDRLDKQSLGYEASLDFPITGPDGKVYTVFHKDPQHKVARWRWGKDTVKERYDELVFENGFVYTKNYESDASVPRNLLVEERFGRTRSGKTELFAIIGANNFPNPKPSKLIAYLVKLFSDKNCVVMDFFAGSGTTLHAVAAQNAKDEGRRQCILCTNNEGGICTDVTYPRIKKVMDGYKSHGNVTDELFREKLTITKLKKAEKLLGEVKQIRKEKKDEYDSIKSTIKEGDLIVTGERTKGEFVPGLGGSLKYYRTAFVGKHGCADALDEDRDELAANAGTMLALAEGTLNAAAVPKKSAKYWRHYTDGSHRHTFVYQSSDYAGYSALSDEVDKIRNGDPKAQIVVYAYTIGGDVAQFENEFDGGLTQLTLKPIPEPILQIYRSVNEESSKRHFGK